MQTLADDRTMVIKKEDEGCCVVFWDRNDYIKEAEKQLNNTNVYNDVYFNDKFLHELVGTNFSKILKLKEKLLTNNLNILSMNIKKLLTLVNSKLCLLPKIHKHLANVPRRPVISNCGTPTEKASELLDHHFKPIMQKGKSYIKDSGDLTNKNKGITEYSRSCNFGNIRCSGPIS